MKNSKSINSFFDRIIQEEWLLPSHISMYISLFQLWSINEFRNPFRICREEVMELSKIRSFATYHKCIRELHQAGFIIYLPSYDSYKGSLIEFKEVESMKILKTQSFQEQKCLPESENKFSAPKFYEVELYFNERDLSSIEANEFYSFYESQHWKRNDKTLMKSWQAAARNWIFKPQRMEV